MPSPVLYSGPSVHTTATYVLPESRACPAADVRCNKPHHDCPGTPPHPAMAMQVSSYEQHLSEAQAASFQALQDQLHSFQNEMAAASHLRTQLVDKDRQIDTIRHDSRRMLLAVASQICHTVLDAQAHHSCWGCASAAATFTCWHQKAWVLTQQTDPVACCSDHWLATVLQHAKGKHSSKLAARLHTFRLNFCSVALSQQASRRDSGSKAER